MAGVLQFLWLDRFTHAKPSDFLWPGSCSIEWSPANDGCSWSMMINDCSWSWRIKVHDGQSSQMTENDNVQGSRWLSYQCGKQAKLQGKRATHHPYISNNLQWAWACTCIRLRTTKNPLYWKATCHQHPWPIFTRDSSILNHGQMSLLIIQCCEECWFNHDFVTLTIIDRCWPPINHELDHP